jgi:hypothetical protein
MEARFQGNHCLVRYRTYLPTPNAFLGIDYQTIHLLGPLLALTLLALSISTSSTAMPLPFNLSPTLLVVSSKYLANRTEKGLFWVQPAATNQRIFHCRGSTGKYTWAVPADLPDGADYAVAFGTAPNIYYSRESTI